MHAPARWCPLRRTASVVEVKVDVASPASPVARGAALAEGGSERCLAALAGVSLDAARAPVVRAAAIEHELSGLIHELP